MARQEVAAALALVLASMAYVPHAVAQAPPDPSALNDEQRAELGRLFKRAKEAYEAKNYLEAIEALKAAHQLFPEPNILYRVGDAYENLGDLAKAAQYYRRYVEAAPDASDAGLVARRIEDLERRAAALEAQLEQTEPERAALLLDSNPAGAMVRLDDRAVDGATPVRVELAPGTHRVELQRDGYASVVREIRIDAGETISLVYQLEKAAAPTPKRRSAWPWIIGGTGVAAVGTSVGLLLASRAAGQKVAAWDQERLDAYEAGGEVLDRPDGYNDAQRQQIVFRNVGFVTGGVGAAALVGGILWLALRGGGSNEASAMITHRGVVVTLRF